MNACLADMMLLAHTANRLWGWGQYHGMVGSVITAFIHEASPWR